MLVNEVREKFIEFFKEKNHLKVKSASLVAKDGDGSVLFNIAGMQQFKLYFSFEKDIFKDFGSNKIVTSQKCLRTVDIDVVGDDSHLTCFEMLGNFSFGAYFKKEAIEFAYEFLFEKLRIDKNKVYITVFEGDGVVPFDEESFLKWKELGIKDIRKGSREDNFWGPVGKTGACGACSEIYYNGVEI